VDCTELVAARKRLGHEIERTRGVKLTYTDLLTAIVAQTLRKHPRMNASWTGDAIKANADVNVGLAMAVTDAVVVGVVPNTDAINLGDIASRRRDLTERARTNKLSPADITGATFTISNLGMYHVDSFTAIIVPPQAGILAVGAMKDRLVPVMGGVAVKPMMTLTLSCDHRVLDGARGACSRMIWSGLKRTRHGAFLVESRETDRISRDSPFSTPNAISSRPSPHRHRGRDGATSL
jgi:pyruvate dehydrogenase E2 component (dihydrolipoamide acetyltransferase)